MLKYVDESISESKQQVKVIQTYPRGIFYKPKYLKSSLMEDIQVMEFPTMETLRPGVISKCLKYLVNNYKELDIVSIAIPLNLGRVDKEIVEDLFELHFKDINDLDIEIHTRD
jgi:hypothetical protein